MNPLQKKIIESVNHSRIFGALEVDISAEEAYQLARYWYQNNIELVQYAPVSSPEEVRQIIEWMPESATQLAQRFILNEIICHRLEWAYPIVVGLYPLGKIARDALKTEGLLRLLSTEELEELRHTTRLPV